MQKIAFVLAVCLLLVFIMTGCQQQLKSGINTSGLDSEQQEINAKEDEKHERCDSLQRNKDILKDSLGLSSSNYNFSNLECKWTRGGYVQAEGTYKEDFRLELYYEAGGCTSSGWDCGMELCLSTNSEELFEEMKERFCPQMMFSNLSNAGCEHNHSEIHHRIAQERCRNGAYSWTEDDMHTFSFKQVQNRCGANVSLGKKDCMS